MKNLMKFAVAAMAALVLMSSAKTAEARSFPKNYTKEYKFSGVVTKEKFIKTINKKHWTCCAFSGKVQSDDDYALQYWLEQHDNWCYGYDTEQISDTTVKVYVWFRGMLSDYKNWADVKKEAKRYRRESYYRVLLRNEFETGLAELKQKMAAEGKELTQVDRAYYACHFVDSRISYGTDNKGMGQFEAMYKKKYQTMCMGYAMLHQGYMESAGVKYIGSAETYDHAMVWFRADNGKRVIIDNYTCIDDVYDPKEDFAIETWEEYYASVKDDFEWSVECRGYFKDIPLGDSEVTTVEELKAAYENNYLAKSLEAREESIAYYEKHHCGAEVELNYESTQKTYWKEANHNGKGNKAGYYYGDCSKKKNRIKFKKFDKNNGEHLYGILDVSKDAALYE